jgi:hypothetical protein
MKYVKSSVVMDALPCYSRIPSSFHFIHFRPVLLLKHLVAACRVIIIHHNIVVLSVCEIQSIESIYPRYGTTTFSTDHGFKASIIIHTNEPQMDAKTSVFPWGAPEEKL